MRYFGEKRAYEETLVEEARMEFLRSSPIWNFFDIVYFVSRSKGKKKKGGKRKRKYFFSVILLKPKNKSEWFSLNEFGNLNGKRYLFDAWATEIFGEEFCSRLTQNPGEYLKQQILCLLKDFKRF